MLPTDPHAPTPVPRLDIRRRPRRDIEPSTAGPCRPSRPLADSSSLHNVPIGRAKEAVGPLISDDACTGCPSKPVGSSTTCREVAMPLPPYDSGTSPGTTVLSTAFDSFVAAPASCSALACCAKSRAAPSAVPFAIETFCCIRRREEPMGTSWIV